MITKTIITTVTVCLIAILPKAAQAQSSNFNPASEFNRTAAPQGAEARVKFSIPLGRSTNRAKTKPRLDFVVRNYATSSSQVSDWMTADRDRYTEARLGFTLEKKPKLMLNNQILHFTPQHEQTNIGTAGKIGLGVGAVALVGVAVVVVIYATTDFAEDA